MESEARRRKIHLITMLLCTFHKVQDIAANSHQNGLLLLLVRFVWTSKKSSRSRACNSGPSSCRKLQRNRVMRQENMICNVSSGTAHNRQKPLPGPFYLATSTLKGRQSRSSYHIKIFILRGIGAFHIWDVQLRTDPLNRALQADLAKKSGVGEHYISEPPRRTPGSRARNESHPRVFRRWGHAETWQSTHQP